MTLASISADMSWSCCDLFSIFPYC